jgi:hypothetical protein
MYRYLSGNPGYPFYIAQIDSIVEAYEGYIINGWACQMQNTNSLFLNLSLTNDYGNVSTKTGYANLSSESIVTRSCAVGKNFGFGQSSYRFSFKLSADELISKNISLHVDSKRIFCCLKVNMQKNASSISQGDCWKSISFGNAFGPYQYELSTYYAITCLNLSFSGLFPPRQATFLHMQGKSLTDLNPEIFRGMSNLTTLYFFQTIL